MEIKRSTAVATAKQSLSGDALVVSVAAASIVAKVTWDRFMTRLGLAHPATASNGIWATACPSISQRLPVWADHSPSEVVAPVAPNSRFWAAPLMGDRRVVASLARLLYSCPVPAVSPARANALRLPAC
jgi:hypothetical protein